MIKTDISQKRPLQGASYDGQTGCTQGTFQGLSVRKSSPTVEAAVKTEASSQQHAIDTKITAQGKTIQKTLSPLPCHGYSPDSFEMTELLPHMPIITEAEKLLARYKDGTLGTLKNDIRNKHVSNEKHTEQIKFEHSLKIVSPSNLTLAAAADYYYKKHNEKYKRDIKIAQITSQMEMRCFIRSMVKKHHDSFQMGVILTKIDEAHVTPFILSHNKKNNETTIVIIDSINEHLEIEQKLQSIDTFPVIENLKVISIGINKKEPRQADFYSCRNDALLILKDALKIADFVSHLKKEGQLKPTSSFYHQPLRKPGFDYFTGPLPPFMGKTAQLNSLVRRFEELENPQPLPPCKFNEGKVKTLQNHLKKYMYRVTASKIEYATLPALQEWKVNLYLQIKGFYIVLHAFEQLKDAQNCIDQEKSKKLMDNYFISYDKEPTRAEAGLPPDNCTIM